MFCDYYSQYYNDLYGQLLLIEWLIVSLCGFIDESIECLQKGLFVFVFVGSIVSFVGLFGIVWGIYYVLVGIGVFG